jgi:ubiquinone/menaquinone biosynthesis C-methylase UbiE
MRLNLKRWSLLSAVVAMLLVPAAAPAQLGSRSAAEWVATLETPQRIASLKIDEVVQKLKLEPGDVVVDIGAGTGLFEGALASAVGPKGIAYAEDVDQALLDHIAARAKALNVTNVRGVLGTFTDPRLPVRTIDVALINDVLHHIEDRGTYLKNLAGYIKPTGRIAVIDYYPERGGHRTQPELQITKEQTAAWMAAAGFKPSEELELFPDKWFIVYSR